MNALPKPLQVLTAGLLVTAAIPLAINQFRQISAAAANEARAAAALKVAQAAVARGDDELAVRAYTEALAQAPDRADARREAAEALARQVVDHPETVTARNALRVQSELALAADAGSASETVSLALGRVELFRGHKTEAQRAFEAVVTANPKNGKALLFLGDLQLKNEELDNAQNSLRRALEAQPDLTLARFALGQVHLQRRQLDEAQPLLEQAAQELSHNGQVALALGRCYALKENWSGAQRQLEHALALEPALVAAHAPLGDAYLNLGMVEAAVGAYRAAWEKSRDLDSLRKIGRIHVQLGNLEAASQVFAQVKDLAPEDPEPHMILGLAAQAAGQVPLAHRAWERCEALAKKGDDRLAVVGRKCAELLAGTATQTTIPAPAPAPRPGRGR